MKLVRLALAAGYPFLVLGALQVFAARWVALLFGGLLLVRWLSGRAGSLRQAGRELWLPAALVGVVLVATAVANSERALLLAPAAVNGALLVAFGRTLWKGPPLVETIARLQVSDLPPDEVRYCRSVTAVWCVFFAANSVASAWIAVAAARSTWALYTGFVAYVLVAVLFSAEFVVRSWRFGRYQGTAVEPLFRRVFPPPRPPA